MHASLIKTLVLLCLFFVVVVGWVFPQPGRSRPSVTAKLGFPADPTSRWGGSESSPALNPPRGQTGAVVLGGFGWFWFILPRREGLGWVGLSWRFQNPEGAEIPG